MPKAAASKSRGFSLFELVIVLAVMTVCIGVTMPSIRTWLQRSEELRLVSLWEQAARVARVLALESGIDSRIRFDRSTSTLCVSSDDSSWADNPVTNLASKFPCPPGTTIRFLKAGTNQYVDDLVMDCRGNSHCMIVEMQLGGNSQRYRTHRSKPSLVTVNN